jgi:hypothetical protein
METPAPPLATDDPDATAPFAIDPAAIVPPPAENNDGAEEKAPGDEADARRSCRRARPALFSSKADTTDLAPESPSMFPASPG